MQTRADHARAAAPAAAFAAGLGLFAWSTKARAAEYVAFETLSLPGEPAARSPAMVTVPAAWDSGVTVAMVLVAAPDGTGRRAQLIADLIHRGVAVAELTFDAARATSRAIADAAHLGVAAAREKLGAGTVLLCTVLLYGVASDAGGAALPLAAAPSDLPPGATVNAAAMLGESCQVATPNRQQPEQWRLHPARREFPPTARCPPRASHSPW